MSTAHGWLTFLNVVLKLKTPVSKVDLFRKPNFLQKIENILKPGRFAKLNVFLLELPVKCFSNLENDVKFKTIKHSNSVKVKKFLVRMPNYSQLRINCKFLAKI